jgi:NAD(P)-dependent dehydrogenase (short-subunit alcohol dehydrogenase family)
VAPRPASPADGIAWVTGGSSGIGKAVALELARRGFQVAITARRQAELAAVAMEMPTHIFAYPADVTDTDAMADISKQLLTRFGAISLVIANAGLYIPTNAEHMTQEIAAYRTTFDVNLMGVINTLAPSIDAMLARGSGQIGIVSSVTGYGGLPTSGAYGATKAALINLCEGLWFDLDPRGIALSIINPGFVDTPATADNPFPMPFLISVDLAAKRIVDGLARGDYEITFPRRFTYLLKLINLLPRPLYLKLVARATGWRGR